MAIDRIEGTAGTGATGATSRADRTPAVPESPRPAGGDSLQLSPEAVERAGLARAAAAIPEVREEEIARLREALADDTYQVDPRQLARALVEFESDLEG